MVVLSLDSALQLAHSPDTPSLEEIVSLDKWLKVSSFNDYADWTSQGRYAMTHNHREAMLTATVLLTLPWIRHELTERFAERYVFR